MFSRDIFFALPSWLRQTLVSLYGAKLAYARFGGSFKSHLESLMRSQYWSADNLRNYQAEKLDQVIQIARLNIPFYRDLFARETSINASTSPWDVLAKLPILTKEIIRMNPEAFVNQHISRMKAVRHRTSGTTGQSFTFFIPREVLYHLDAALTYRFYAWFGIKVGDRRITLGGRVLTKKPPYCVYNRWENQLLLSIHHLRKETVLEYVDQIRRFAPVFIQGHPSGLHFLAERMLECNDRVKVKAIITTGETLGEEQRRVIEQAFETRVYQSYGVGEGVFAAYECEEQDGFHEASEFGIMDFERTSNGQYFVNATSLWNTAMPFLRYRVEDIVTPTLKTTCRCGRGLPKKIAKVIGRSDEPLIASNGAMVMAVTVRMAMKCLILPFEYYQVQQIDRYDFIVKLTGQISPARCHSIIARLRLILGERVQVVVEQVPTVQSSGGKTRNVVNLWRIPH
jgi:phenylacetate-CoA ligase